MSKLFSTSSCVQCRESCSREKGLGYLGGLVIVVGDEAEASKDHCCASDQLSVVEDLELVEQLSTGLSWGLGLRLHCTVQGSLFKPGLVFWGQSLNLS